VKTEQEEVCNSLTVGQGRAAVALPWWRSGGRHVCGLNLPTVTPVSTTMTRETQSNSQAVVRLPGAFWPQRGRARRRSVTGEEGEGGGVGAPGEMRRHEWAEKVHESEMWLVV
jgi:hypothetical protein